MRILKHHRRIGLITPYSLLVQNYGRKIRSFIIEKYKIIEILDVSAIRVFQDAMVKPIVLIIEKERPADHSFPVLELPDQQNILYDTVATLNQKAFTKTFNNMIRLDINEAFNVIMEKVESQSIQHRRPLFHKLAWKNFDKTADRPV